MSDLDDLFRLGTTVYVVGIRKWYNPMRWIKGPLYRNRIANKDFFKP